MSRLKNMSRAGLVVTGIVIALLLVPTGAAAKGLKIAGIIEGTSGNKADVTTTGNLKVAVASPANFFYQEDATGPGSGFDSPAVTPPAGTDLIMTIIHLNVFSDPAPGSASSIDLFVAPSTACNTGAGPYFQSVNPAGIGEQDVSLDPGVGVPSGDVLCAGEFGSVQAKLDVSGYTVTAHSITAGPVHLLPRDPGGR
jgi:hypothetical protein